MEEFVVSKNDELEYSLQGMSNLMWQLDLASVKDGERNGIVNVGIGLKLRGDLDVSKMERSIQRLIDNTDSMRGIIVNRGEEYFIKIRKYYKDFKLEVLEVEGNSDLEREQNAMQVIQGSMDRAIDVFNNIPIDIKLYRINEQYHYMLFKVHHCFTDAVSVLLSVETMLKLYDNESYEFSTLREPFQNLLQEDYEYMMSENAKKSIQYWQEEFEGYSPKPPQIDYNRQCIKSGDLPPIQLNLENITSIATLNRTSDFNVIMLILHLALAKTNNSNDIGTTYLISNRMNGSKYQDTIGSIARIIDTRYIFEENEKISSMHKKIRSKISKGLNNCRVAGGRTPYLITYLNIVNEVNLPKFNGLPVETFLVKSKREDCGILCFAIIKSNDFIEIGFETDTRLFSLEYLNDIKKNCILAEQFLNNQAESTFKEYMCK